MCIVIKVDGLGNRRVSGEPKQFYHPCGTQGAHSCHVDVVDVSYQLDAVASCIEGLKTCVRLRIHRNLRAHVGRESLPDRARESRCPLQASANLDAIRLALRTRAPIESVSRQQITTVLDVGTRGIDKAQVSRAFASGSVRE